MNIVLKEYFHKITKKKNLTNNFKLRDQKRSQTGTKNLAKIFIKND